MEGLIELVFSLTLQSYNTTGKTGRNNPSFGSVYLPLAKAIIQQMKELGWDKMTKLNYIGYKFGDFFKEIVRERGYSQVGLSSLITCISAQV